MIATIKITVELAPGETMPSEADAVRQMQDQFAALARMTPAELVEIWHQAMTLQQQRKQRPKHAHRAKAKGANR